MTTMDIDLSLRSIDLMDPVALHELVGRVSLISAADRTYLLEHDDAEVVLAGLAGDARVLDIDGQRSFGYEAVYFDIPDLTGYLLAARARRRRFRVRRRSAVDSGECFLEVQVRDAWGGTDTDRMLYDGVPPSELDDTDLAFIADVLDTAGIESLDTRWFRPTLRTGYRRSTLYLPACGSRVTVDTDLTWALPGRTPLELPGGIVIETAGGSGICAADRHLRARGHRPRRISKYATALATLSCDLPANRWRSVVSSQLQPRPTTTGWASARTSP